MNDPAQNKPLVSVIVAAYNAETTVADALDSVLLQTLPADEIIVADDASSDGTAAAVEAWARAHPATRGSNGASAVPALRLVRLSSNRGPAGARNDAIAHASGKWLAFLDSDDAWFPWKLEEQMRAADHDGSYTMICGRAVDWDEVPAARPSSPAPVRIMSRADLAECNHVATSSVLLLADAARAAGLFDEQFRGPEDYDLWMRIALRGRIAVLDCPFVRRRTRPGSLSMDDRTLLPEVLRVLEKAFGSGGAMTDLAGECRSAALSTQYWSASWMAFNRGDRATALRLLAQSFRSNLASPRRARRTWIAAAARYCFGRLREDACAGEGRASPGPTGMRPAPANDEGGGRS